MPLVARSNVQQSRPDFAFTCRLTTPCSPMPARRAPSSGCFADVVAAPAADTPIVSAVSARQICTAPFRNTPCTSRLLVDSPATVAAAKRRAPLRKAESAHPLRKQPLMTPAGPPLDNELMSTVLVVDDEPIVRDVVVRYLEQEGFRTLQAGDGETARRLLEQETPSLVVLDLMLPGTDGLALCRWIRSRSELPVTV